MKILCVVAFCLAGVFITPAFSSHSLTDWVYYSQVIRNVTQAIEDSLAANTTDGLTYFNSSLYAYISGSKTWSPDNKTELLQELVVADSSLNSSEDYKPVDNYWLEAVNSAGQTLVYDVYQVPGNNMTVEQAMFKCNNQTNYVVDGGYFPTNTSAPDPDVRYSINTFWLNAMNFTPNYAADLQNLITWIETISYPVVEPTTTTPSPGTAAAAAAAAAIANTAAAMQQAVTAAAAAVAAALTNAINYLNLAGYSG